RRHLRLAARRNISRKAAPFDFPNYPPLWHLYPDDVFLRRHGDGWSAVAACRCGALGGPGGLAWMGDRCGPCHDRALEGRDEPRPVSVLRGDAGGVYRVAVAPDGAVVASSDNNGRMRVWDRNGRLTIDHTGGGLIGVARGGKRLVTQRGYEIQWLDAE